MLSIRWLTLTTRGHSRLDFLHISFPSKHILHQLIFTHRAANTIHRCSGQYEALTLASVMQGRATR